MSYKKAFTLGALGLGALIQGCSKDDDDGEEDRGCKTVTDFDAIKAGTNDVPDCNSCLDQEITNAETCDFTDYAAAKAAVSAGSDDAKKIAAFTCVANAWEACSAEIPADATNCDGSTFTAVTATGATAGPAAVMTQVGATDFNCRVCVAVGPVAGDAATCVEIVDNVQSCGSNIAKTEIDKLRCPDCSGTNNFKSSDALCKACLDSQTENGWSAPGADATDADFAAAWSAYGVCGSVAAVDSCGSTSLDLDLTYADAPNVGKNSDLESSTVISNAGASCKSCIDFNIAQNADGVRNCFTYTHAITACTDDGTVAPTDLVCKTDVCQSDAAQVLPTGDCLTCLKGQADDNDWEDKDFFEADFNSAWDPYVDCAGTDAHFATSCPATIPADTFTAANALLQSNGNTDAAALTAVSTAVDTLGTNGDCSVCMHASLAETVTTAVAATCAQVQDALNSCSGGTAYTAGITC